MAKGKHYRSAGSAPRRTQKPENSAASANRYAKAPEDETVRIVEIDDQDDSYDEAFARLSEQAPEANFENAELPRSSVYEIDDEDPAPYPQRRRRSPIPVIAAVMLLLACGILFYMAAELGLLGSFSLTGSTQATPTPAATETPAPTEEPTPEPTPTPTPEPTPPEIYDDGTEGYVTNDVCIYNNKGYQLFTAAENSAGTYAEVLNAFADELTGMNLYSIVVPSYSEFGLPERVREYYGVTDQQAYIDTVYSSLSGSFTTVNVYDILNLHNDEAIYMGTDTYWTALGAYYAYTEFCEAAGCEAAALDSFTETDYEISGWLAQLTGESCLYENPDTLPVYEPAFSFTCERSQDGYSFYEADTISLSDESLGYDMYNAGDMACVRVTNHDVSTGRKLLVVKDCYGNAMAPFLMASFDEVHTVDYRYFAANLTDYCAEQGITDVLFLNGTTYADSTTQHSYMQALFD